MTACRSLHQSWINFAGFVRGNSSFFVCWSVATRGATVIDVGINATEGGIVGDVDYDAVAPIAGAITPVPGGAEAKQPLT